MEDLTPREQQVIQLVAQGLSNKAIAECLQFSEHAAKFHVANIAKKLGVHKRTLIAVVAVREGLV